MHPWKAHRGMIMLLLVLGGLGWIGFTRQPRPPLSDEHVMYALSIRVVQGTMPHLRTVNAVRSDGVPFPDPWIAAAPFVVQPTGDLRLSPIRWNATQTEASVRIGMPGCNYGAWYDVTLAKHAGTWAIQSHAYGGEGWC